MADKDKISSSTPKEDRSPISKAVLDKCDKMLYHGTHRDLDIKFLGIHVCKNRANLDIKAPVVYMHRLLGIAAAHVVPFMVGHGSKLSNYQEHIVELDHPESMSKIPKEIEIVHNDPDLKDCEGETTGYIYCVNKEDCKDVLYYATPKHPKDWLFVSYKMLPVAEKKEVTVKWKKHYDESFAKKIKSGGESVVESLYEDIDDVDPAFEGIGNVLDKRKQITAYIVDVMNIMDPSKDNGKYWNTFLNELNDRQFAQFMEHLKNKKTAISITMPNMKKSLIIADLLNAAKKVNYTTSHKLWLTDRTSERKFLTNEKYLVLKLPIRRAQQEVDKKLSVPSRDSRIDALTGQVTGPDRACALSAPEIQSLNTRGLEVTLNELVRVRGGDIHAYGDFKRQLEETGEAALNSLDPRTRTRSSVITGVFLTAMHLENNL